MSKYLMLMVEKFLHTFFLTVFECSTADLVHEEQNSFVPVPQVLLNQYPHPKLQHCCSTNTTRLTTLYHMTLKDRNLAPFICVHLCFKVYG